MDLRLSFLQQRFYQCYYKVAKCTLWNLISSLQHLVEVLKLQNIQKEVWLCDGESRAVSSQTVLDLSRVNCAFTENIQQTAFKCYVTKADCTLEYNLGTLELKGSLLGSKNPFWNTMGCMDACSGSRICLFDPLR